MSKPAGASDQTLGHVMPVVHPCLCGFRCDAYWLMRRHQASCDEWKNRPDPRSLSIWRRHKTGLHAVDPTTVCEVCSRRQDRHAPGCVNGSEDATRLAALERNDIDPAVFSVFLRLLAKRYE